ncbi:Rieske (2Fe-2S) protein [Pseudonocardia sp. GCM10023141]|uniref:Rieske (2Fe-2S) protein n=1 Tax=Pseudonocardia sp. GCM10023141 TaxID=3252653 RepID=UPI00360858EA
MEHLTRRAVLAGACTACAAVAVTGCAGYGAGGPAAAAPAPAAGGAPPAAGAAPAAGGALTTTADIPVGGGKIFADKGVVVTQPVAGTFKAFSTTCTHQGCTVTAVAGGTINCPCHGSKFRIADGSVAGGPAPKPLPSASIAVKGTAITLA